MVTIYFGILIFLHALVLFFVLKNLKISQRFQLKIAQNNQSLQNQLQTEIRESAKLGFDSQRSLGMDLNSRTDQMRTEILLHFRDCFQELREKISRNLFEMQTTMTTSLNEMREKQVHSFDGLQKHMQTNMDAVRKDNFEKLEKIRETVEGKLQATLETRLGESFKLVSERLESVHKGLGEMQTLASGVGDLKRVLTNVRSRGTFGETQLESLLEQVLVPSQYEKNVCTIPGTTDRVEFAIKLPGHGDGNSTVYLPIDAKFPREDYERLQQAYEINDLLQIEESRKALRRRVLDESEKIRKKYISPPHTTDVALLFFPTEGLYAEVLRIPDVWDAMQSLRIIPVGPSTLYAVLNSLHMGFRTLAIQKRSSEVWEVLGAVKTEFGKFGKSLSEVKEKLQQAANKIDSTAVRTRAMEKALKNVEALNEVEADLKGILPLLNPLEALPFNQFDQE